MTKLKTSFWTRVLLAFVVAGCALGLDQYIKHRVLGGTWHTYLNDQLVIGPFYNHGIAFSISLPDILLGLAIISSLVFVFWLAFFELTKNRPLASLAYGLVLGGSLGNALDRIRVGAVVDYIHVFQTSVFNIADVFIAIGLIIIVVLLFQRKPQENSVQ